MRLDSRKVRWHRDRFGWTLDELADKAGVAKGTLLRAEHGEDIQPRSGRRIAQAFGVDISELVPDRPGVMLPKAEAPSTPGQPGEERPLIDHPEVQEWLTKQGHTSKGEFFSWAEQHKSLEEVEDAINDLHTVRDRLLEVLNDPTVQETLFPRRRGLVAREERVSEALQPGKLTWKLKNEIRNEYLARETALVNYSRLLFVEGEAEDYLVRGPISEYDYRRHEQMLEARRVLEESYAKVAAG